MLRLCRRDPGSVIGLGPKDYQDTRSASIEIKECEDWIVKTSFYKDIWIGCNTMTKRPVVITLQI